MSADYQLMAARIETVLSAHKVPARVWQATVTPRFVRYDVTTALGIRLDAAKRLSEEIAFSLGASAVRIYRDAGVLHVEVPRQAPRQVLLDDILGRVKVPPLCAMLGVDEEGNPLLIRLDSPDVAHILVAGTTGSGKSVLLRSMIATLARCNRPGRLQFLLADPKRTALRAFGELPHTQQIASAPEQICTLLTGLVAEMGRRSPGALPHLVLAIDEMAEILMSAPDVIPALTRLTQYGRELNIHVLAATQHPSSALVGGMLKANFPVRLVGSVASPEDAKVASGMAGSGAERLLGQGDFLLVSKGKTIRFQAAYADDAVLANFVDRIGRVQRRPAVLTLRGGVGSGVGTEDPKTLLLGSAVPGPANPTQPNPTKSKRRSLRERYTPEELYAFMVACNGRIKDAARTAFGYSDTATLSIMREAAMERANAESFSIITS